MAMLLLASKPLLAKSSKIIYKPIVFKIVFNVTLNFLLKYWLFICIDKINFSWWSSLTESVSSWQISCSNKKITISVTAPKIWVISWLF